MAIVALNFCQPARCQNSLRAAFYVGPNQHIYHYWAPPGVAWAVEDLMGTSGAPAVATQSPIAAFENSPINVRDVFYLGTTQHLYHLWSNPGMAWAWEDLTASVGGAPVAAPGSPLVGFQDSREGFREVFYLTAAQHVCHFWSNPGYPWGLEDLTAEVSGAPPAAANSSLSAFEDDQHNLREVFFLGSNQHIYHFWAVPGQPWGMEDLTASVGGAALALPAGPIAAFENDRWDLREVFYFGTNQHIYHFWSTPGYPWGVEDLTGATSGSPPALNGSPLVAFEDSLHDLREVFYLAGSQHVYHFWSMPAQPWGIEDLTASSGASLVAVGTPMSGFENSLSDFRELFYLGASQHVYHFWATPGYPWGIEDVTAPTPGAPPAIAGSALSSFAEAGLSQLISGQLTAAGTPLVVWALPLPSAAA